MADVLIRRWMTQRHTGRVPWNDRGRNQSEASRRQTTPRPTGCHRSQGRGTEWILPHNPPREPPLPTPVFQTWQFQKSERIILYWSRYLTSGYIVIDRHSVLLRRVFTLLPQVCWATTFSAILYQYNLMYFLVFKNMSKYLVHHTQDS